MTSVGIMSMQRIFNYGSSLQSYALRRLVEEVQASARVTYVDYTPGPALQASPASSLEDKGALGRNLAKLRQYGAADIGIRNKIRFINHKRSYAKNYFPLIGVPQGLNRDLNVDLQIIGSDEVFNCVQSNTRVGYSTDLFGRDSPAGTVTSYAGSFGSTTLDKLRSAGIEQSVAKDLSRFDAISVRDQNSSDIVETLTGRVPDIHVDPTLVYDFSEITSSVSSRTSQFGKYIMVYGYSSRFTDEENTAVAQYAKSIGARVLAFGGNQRCADEFIDCDPFTLLAYFRDSSAVITDTFHGTIFSIINEVPFVTLVRRPSILDGGNFEKLSYLLSHFGLDYRIRDSHQSLESLFEDQIDYIPVRDRRQKDRVQSISYLSEVTSGNFTGKVLLED